MRPESRFFESQRSRRNYVDWGNPEAPTLILLHGGRDSCRAWDWVASALAADWHVVAPDLKGHGDSDWSSDGAYPMAGFVLDLATFVAHLGRDRVTIIGHSLGGNIALRFVASHPDLVDRLVAVEGMGPSTQTLRRLALPPGEQLRSWVTDRRTLAGRKPRRYRSIDEAAARLLDGNPHLTADRAKHLAAEGVRAQEDGTYTWKYDNYTRGFAPVDTQRPRDLWREIACPVLLVHGSESWAVEQLSPDNLSCFRNATVAMIDGAGHWPQHDHEPEFLAAVTAFLRPA